MRFAPTYRGFLAFCDAVDYTLAPFQRRIARAHFGRDREVVCVLPRGSAKSTLAAHLAVFHCLSRPNPGVYVGSASRDMARIVGSMIRSLSRHPVVAEHVVWRTDALRWASDPKGPAILQVVAADGAKAHGWPHPTLMIGDEVWTWSDREPTLLGAMTTAMLKNPEARFLGISTAASSLNSPLGRLRTRALAQAHVKRTGAFLEAHGDGLRWLEWSVAETRDPEDMRAVAAANPLRTVSELREQRPRVTEVEWLQFHCCRWGVGSARWLPAGAWQAGRAVYEVDPDAPLVLGIDIGGSRSASAAVGIVRAGDTLQVATIEILQGTEAVLGIVDHIERLIAAGWNVREVVFDPMRFSSEALRLGRAHSLQLTEWPQSETRMTICSENLHRVITEHRLQHPGDPDLDRHVSNARAKPTPRGWRLVKAADSLQIDGTIALAMAVERAEHQPEPVQLLGWL